MTVASFSMTAGSAFERHSHLDHQLAWAASGVLTVVTDRATWVLPPTRALWIPAGVAHETRSARAAMMRSAYVRPDRCPIRWPAPTPVAASRLLAELMGYLADDTLGADRRARGESVLVDLLEPVPMTTIELRRPAAEPALQVARALARDPADRRALDDWGRQVGASGRTLARAFVVGTGITFGRWRTRMRLQAALPGLAAGEPVARVARRVGYETASAFVAAFHRETGTTPAAYFAVPPATVPPTTGPPTT